MANDGSITFSVWLDAGNAEKELTNIKKKIMDLQTELSAQQKVKGGLEERLAAAGVAADNAKAKLQELIATGASASRIRAQESIVKGLDKDFEAAAAAVEKQNAKIDETNAKLDAETERYGRLQQMTNGLSETSKKAGDAGVQAAKDTGTATDGLASRLDKLTSRIAGLAKRVLFFSLFTRAFRAFRDYVGKALQTSDEFTAAVARLKGALATGFQPIFTAVLPAIVALINILAKAAAMIASFISLIFGSTVEASAAAAESLNDEADALGNVGGGAAKAEKQLASFDQINKLSDNAGGGGGGLSKKGKIDTESFSVVNRFTKLLQELDFSNLRRSLADLKESFSSLAQTIGRGLEWAWNNILVPLAHWTIEELAPRMVELLAKAFDLLNAVLEKLGPILEPFWENVLKPLFEWLGRLILTGLDELIDLLDKLTALINGDISWSEFIEGLDGVQWALLALGGVAVLSAIGNLTTAIAGIPISIGKTIPKLAANLAKMAKAAATGALAVFDGVMIAYDVVKLKEAADTYNEAQLAHNHETEVALSSYAKLYEEKGKEAADAWAGMVYQIDTTNMSFEEAQAAIAETIEGYWDGVPQNMWEGFKQGWDYYFGEDGKGLWQLFKDAFNNVIQWVKDLLGIHSPSTVFQDIGSDIVQGLWNGFKAKWDEFYLNLQGWWNSLKTWWDGLSLKTIVGEVTGGTTVNMDGFSHSYGKIPKLASGAVIPPNREFLAVLGDQTAGTNIEAPLDTMVAAFRQAMNSSNGGGQPLTVQVFLDSRQIYEGQQQYARTMGV